MRARSCAPFLDESIDLRVALSVLLCKDGLATRASDTCDWLRLAPVDETANARVDARQGREGAGAEWGSSKDGAIARVALVGACGAGGGEGGCGEGVEERAYR